MKVRVRRPYLGKEGKTHRGQELEISEQRFRELTTGIHASNPLVDATEVGYKMEVPHKNKMEAVPANKRIDLSGKRVDIPLIKNPDGSYKLVEQEVASTASADPTASRPAGGRTGEGSVASSLEPDPQPTKRRYTRRVAEPASSASTEAGSSRRGRTASTAVTSPGGRNTRASRSSKG